MTDRIPIMPVFEAYGGRVARWKAYGWTACYCVLPGHDDQTASAQINGDSQRWRCLACSVNFDAIALVQAIEGLRFKEARARALHIAGADGTGAPSLAREGSLLPHRNGRPTEQRRRYRPPWLKT